MVAWQQTIPWALVFILSLIILVKSSDALIESASNLAIALGTHEFVIGVLIVGFGTSLPELVSATYASVVNSGGLAAGNMVGSSISIVLLVLGVVSMFGAIYSTWEGKRRDVYLMIILSFALFAMSLDGVLSRSDAFIIICGVIASFYVMLQEEAGRYRMNHHRRANKTDLIIIVIALFAIVFGAKYFIDSASQIALVLGFPKYVIGLSIVALGTTLPELFSSIAAFKQRRHAMVLGNMVGSAIFTIAILGWAAAIRPIAMPTMLTLVHIPIMILCLVTMAALIKFGQIPKYAGLVFLPGYAVFLYLAYALV